MPHEALTGHFYEGFARGLTHMTNRYVPPRESTASITPNRPDIVSVITRGRHDIAVGGRCGFPKSDCIPVNLIVRELDGRLLNGGLDRETIRLVCIVFGPMVGWRCRTPVNAAFFGNVWGRHTDRGGVRRRFDIQSKPQFLSRIDADRCVQRNGVPFIVGQRGKIDGLVGNLCAGVEIAVPVQPASLEYDQSDGRGRRTGNKGDG